MMSAKSENSETSNGKKKILIIDDEYELVKMLKLRLEANGYEVVTAHDGIEGISVWRTESPDLIILDVMMPEMDGFSFVRESKGREELKPAPIIVMTAKEGMKDLFEVEGVAEYITKPYNDEELLKLIKKHI